MVNLMTWQSGAILMATWKAAGFGVVLGLCVAGGLTSLARADAKEDVANAKARVEAARKVYQGMLERQKQVPGAFDAEKLYRWSRRWMEAQQDVSATKKNQVAAIEAHLDRMKRVEKTVKDLIKAGATSDLAPFEAKAAEFYRLEAEKWLRKAKGK
jgi:hypothetical protein